MAAEIGAASCIGFGNRRSPTESHRTPKICLDVTLDESSISPPTHSFLILPESIDSTLPIFTIKSVWSGWLRSQISDAESSHLSPTKCIQF